MSVETLYTCGKSARYATLMLLEDGRMVVRDEVGVEILVKQSITPKQAEGFLRDLYLSSKERLKAEDEWNETEKENAALQDRRANFRDGEYIIFWTFVQTFLG